MAMQSSGLGFFYLDVDFFDNDAMVLLEMKYGSRATLLAVKLLCKIYHENFYYVWGEEESMLFTRKLGGEYTVEYVQSVVDALMECGFFHKEYFKQYGILTSKEVQMHFFEASHRRKSLEVNGDYLLVDAKHYKNMHVKGEPEVSTNALDVDNPEESVDISSTNEMKENEMKISPSNPPKEEVKEEDILSSVPQDGVKRNSRGLIEELHRLGIGMNDIARLAGYCNYGVIGHPVWQALTTIRGANGQIKQPLKFIWSRVKASTHD